MSSIIALLTCEHEHLKHVCNGAGAAGSMTKARDQLRAYFVCKLSFDCACEPR